jgi:Tfp pilus assembly protein PilW
MRIYKIKKKKLSGFSLLELMISLFIGLFIIGAIFTFFVSAKVANRITDRVANLQETGRYAIDIIGRDISRAGYYVGNANLDDISGTTGITAVVNTCSAAGNSWGTMLEQHIYGIDDAKTGYACITNAEYLRGDVLTLRFASPWTVVPASNSELYLRSSLFEGRVFLGTAANNAANTNITSANQTTHFLMARSYFVGTSNETCQSKEIPALFWKSLESGVPKSEQLLVGVEHLQFEYGVDNTGDGSTNQYLSANNVLDWDDVSSMRVSVLVRDDCPDASYTDTNTYTMGDVVYKPSDNYHRLLLQTTISLRNVLNNVNDA